MQFPFLLAVLLLLLVLVFLPSCAGSYRMREGMTKEEVSAKLGQPIRIDQERGGRETWYYTTVVKSRTRGVTSNYERPGESLYERDLRIDAQGPLGGVEFTTIEEYEEKALRFDARGRLTSSPPWSFLSRE